MGNGDGVGPLSRSAYTKSHSYLLVNQKSAPITKPNHRQIAPSHPLHSSIPTKLASRSLKHRLGEERERKDAFAGVADLEKGVRS